MYKVMLKKQLRGYLYLLGAMALFFTSCVDENYDLTKDIDMTVGFGTEGLSVKLGTTDKILLKDILEEDETIKVDEETSLYYLVEEGDFETNFDVEGVSTKIDPIEFKTGEILDYNKIKKMVEDATGITIPSTLTEFDVEANLEATGEGSGNSSFKFNLTDVDKAILELSEVYPQSGTKAALKINISQTPGLKFGLKKINRLDIVLPQFLPLDKNDITSEYPYTLDGHKLTITNVENIDLSSNFVTINIDLFNLLGYGKVQNGSISLPTDICSVSVDGSFSFYTTGGFTMHTTDNVKVSASVGIVDIYGNDRSNVSILKVLGKFDPEINPVIDPIDIASSLPDFLQDDEVYLDMANPTLKIYADLRHQSDRADVPFNLFFSGELKGEKEGVDSYKPVVIKEEEIETLKENYFYFYQADKPYEPGKIPEQAKKQQIKNLTDLLTPQIPDRINIDMSDGKIHVDKMQEYMVTLNSSYKPRMEYMIQVPFAFNKGFKIVYKDSTESMNDDLKDLAAEGVTVTTDVHTTIPLKLHATVEALDVNGKEIKLKDSPVANIPACSSSKEEVKNISLLINLKDPYDLSKIDRIRFNVKAEAGEINGSKELKSNQYLFMKDIRVKLNGQVIIDLN